MHALGILLLFVLGFAGLWFGLVEDVKISFALAILFLAAATFITFSGRPGEAPPPPQHGTALTTPPGPGAQQMALPVAIVGGFLIGALGVWLGLVEDVKIAMLVGILIWAGAVLATFRGKWAL